MKVTRTKIDSSKVVVKNPLIQGGGGSSEGDMLQARVNATNSCSKLFIEYTGNNVDYISKLDTSSVTTMQNMFYSCENLTSIPPLDTSNVTNMGGMFYGCSNLTTIPQLNTSKVTSMTSMFSACSNLTTIPQLDTSNVTSTGQMFYSCKNLTSIPPLDTSNVNSSSGMFAACSNLTAIPQLDTSKMSDLSTFVSNCKQLTTIPLIDMIKCRYTNSMFHNCSALKNLTLKNIKISLTIGSGTSWGHLLTLDSLINTIKELVNVGSSLTLTMGTTNLAKITDVYVKFTDSSVTSIATNEKGEVEVCESTDEGAMTITDYALLKNWTLA